MEQELRENKVELGDLLVIGLSAAKAQDVCKALGHGYDFKKYEAVNALGLVQDIQRSDYSGSRGYGRNAARGYFKATSEERGDVLLFLGDYDGYEQAALVNYMSTLNEDTRALFPEIYGTYVEENKTYLVMEKLHNLQDQCSLRAQEFLEKCGQYLQPSFADRVSRTGINVSRTTIEYDYMFRDDAGGIRLGIPYRALGFVRDSKEYMLSADAFKPQEQLKNAVAKVDVQPL